MTHWKPVPNERAIGKLVFDKRRGQTRYLNFEDGGQIHYGDCLEVTSEWGQVDHWKMLYNPENKRNELHGIESHLYNRAGGDCYADYESCCGIPVTPDMTLPKQYKEKYWGDWWEYIHNTYSKKNEKT